MKDWDEAFESAGYKKIKLTLSKSKHLFVKARINGVLGDFILDTGASATCVSQEAVAFFDLASQASETTASGAGATNMTTAVSEHNELKLGRWKTDALSLIILDLSHINHALTSQKIKPVYGIIGGDVLEKSHAVIDYGQKKMYLR